MTSSAVANPNIVTQAARKIRIQALDVIRGISILGILAVNADGFAAPQSASLNPANWPFPNKGSTAISYWVMDTFFHEKFLTLFSMLFGISLYLVGGELKDKRKSQLLARRLGILFLFGMLHGFGIWWGDILSLYATTGFLMFFLRSWRPKLLLTCGVLLYVAIACSSIIRPAVLPLASHGARTAVGAHIARDESAIALRKAKIAKDVAAASSSLSGAYRLNTMEYLHLLSGDPSLVPQTLALMMIGLSLFKTGFLAGKSSNWRYVTVIAIGAAALGPIGWLSWHVNVRATPVLGEHGFVLLLSPLVSLAYVSCLVLLLRLGYSAALAPLSAAGRMAFTNYLTQSLIMTSIFYGGRGGLMGKIDRPGLWLITVAVWTVQLVWSPIWLAHFEMGPLEWVWRSLTAGNWVPLRKSVGSEQVA